MADFINLLYLFADRTWKSRLIRPISIFLSVMVLAFVVQECTYYYANKKSVSVMTKLLKYRTIFNDSLILNKSDNREVLLKKEYLENRYYVYLPNKEVKNLKIKRMFSQLNDVVLRAHNHLVVAEEFMIQSFVSVTTSSIFFILSAFCIAYITKTGFSTAHPALITLFLSTLAVASFYFSLTKIFKQEENANNNITAYLGYINLEQVIRTELAINQDIEKIINHEYDTSSSLSEKIVEFDQAIMSSNKIHLGFESDLVQDISVFKKQIDAMTN